MNLMMTVDDPCLCFSKMHRKDDDLPENSNDKMPIFDSCRLKRDLTCMHKNTQFSLRTRAV